jgi:hypothetical protein
MSVDGWYLSEVLAEIVEGKVVCTETILIKPTTERVARHTCTKWRALLGMENLHVCKPNTKRYRKLMKLQRSRHRAARDLTVAEVAEIIEEVEKMRS